VGILKEKDREKLTGIFKELKEDVKIMLFTQEMECMHCEVTRTLLEEISGISEKLSLTVHDFVTEAYLARKYGVDKIPATIVSGDRDYGIRFYGVPSGYEFNVLIEDILYVGKRDPELDENVMVELAKIDQPVHIQVLISPTCPYCASAVRTLHRFAIASHHITADMVESSEFSFLAVKYNVQGVPHTVINEKHSIVGTHPEIDFARKILAAIGK